MVPVFGFGISLFGVVFIGLVTGSIVLAFLLELFSGKTNGEMKSVQGAILVFIAVVGVLLAVVPRGYEGPATYTGIETYHDRGDLVQTPKVKVEGIDGLYEVTNTEIASYTTGDTVNVLCRGYSCEVK